MIAGGSAAHRRVKWFAPRFAPWSAPGFALALCVLLPIAAPAAATVPVTHPAAAEPAAPVVHPAEQPFVPPTHELAAPPSSLADGVRALARPTPAERWHAAWDRHGLSIGDIVRVAGAQPLLPIALAGFGLIVLASLVRRRHRRQVGWGMLPERHRPHERRNAAD